MSFLPDRVIDRYFLILKPPYGREEGSTQERPNEEQKKQIEKWLYKKFMNFPHIPELFFENLEEQKKTKKSPLDVFSALEYELNRLENFKTLIYENLDGLKNQFNTIIFDKSKYNVDPSSSNNALPNSILSSNSDLVLENLFFDTNGKYSFFPNFIIHGYMNNENNLFQYTGSSTRTPFFAKIFNDSYNGEVKEFILQLFKEYIQIRNSLIKKITKYYGILAFKPIFDFRSEDILQIEQKKSKQTNRFNKNFVAPPLYNGVNLNLKENSNYNSSYESFLSIQNEGKGKRRKNKLSEEQKLKLEESYKFMRLKTTDNIFKNYGNENILEFSHKEKIKTIFAKLCENLKNIYNIQFMDLYQLMLYSIELDYLTLEFIYYFVRPDLFINALNVKKQIYRFINKNIDLYYDYIEEFDLWIYNYLLKYQIDPFATTDRKFEEVYQTFHNFIMNMFDKTKLERNSEFVNQLNNEGVFVDIETSNSKPLINDDELKEYLEIMKKLSNNSQSV